MKNGPILDIDAERCAAAAAVEDFFANRWDAYLEAVRRVETLPENQSGADKTWVDRARAAYRAHYHNVVRIERTGK